MFIVLSNISRVFLSILGVIDINLYAGAVDYAEWKDGVRNSGLIMSVRGVGVQISQSISTTIRTIALQILGYKKGMVITDTFKTGLIRVYGWSSIFSFLAAIVIMFYPITNKKLDEMREDIVARRKEKGIQV